MDEPLLKLEHRHRPIDAINSDIAESLAELEDVRGRKKTCDAGFKEESDAAKDALKKYGEERRKAMLALSVVRMQSTREGDGE